MKAKPARLTPPLKWHGGKRYLADEIIARMPRHLNYVEPYAGGLQVLLRRDPADRSLWWSDKHNETRGVNEVANDIDGRLTNFYAVLRDPAAYPEFRRRCEFTPASEAVWREAGGLLDDHDPVTQAWAFFVRCRQSRSGLMRSFAPSSRSRLRGNRNEQANEWLDAIDGLADVHARLRPVRILNQDALKVIREWDQPGTLFYLDPPYSHETRTAKAAYRYEMSVVQHRELLGLITDSQFSAKVILSGYANPMYDDALDGWHREEIDISNHAAGGKKKRRMTEVLWCNFKPATAGTTFVVGQTRTPSLFRSGSPRPQVSAEGRAISPGSRDRCGRSC